MRNFNPSPWWRARFAEIVGEPSNPFPHVRSALELVKRFNDDPRQYSEPSYGNVGYAIEATSATHEKPLEDERRDYLLEYLRSDIFGYGFLKEIGAASPLADIRMVLQRFKCPYCDRRLAYRLSTPDGSETAEEVGLSYSVYYFHDIENFVKGISLDSERNSVIDIQNERLEESFVFICTDCARQVPRSLPLSFLSNDGAEVRTKWNPFQVPSFPAEFDENWGLVPRHGKQRGLSDVTIEYFNLNRPDLVERRKQEAMKMRLYIEELFGIISNNKMNFDVKLHNFTEILTSNVSPKQEFISVCVNQIEIGMGERGVSASRIYAFRQVIEMILTIFDYLCLMLHLIAGGDPKRVYGEVEFVNEETKELIRFCERVGFFKDESSIELQALDGFNYSDWNLDEHSSGLRDAVEDWATKRRDLLGRLITEVVVSVLRGCSGSEKG